MNLGFFVHVVVRSSLEKKIHFRRCLVFFSQQHKNTKCKKKDQKSYQNKTPNKTEHNWREKGLYVVVSDSVSLTIPDKGNIWTVFRAFKVRKYLQW